MRGDGIGADSCWIRGRSPPVATIVISSSSSSSESSITASCWATSQGFYFDSDSIGVRATFGFGQKIADPARVVKLTVATPGS